MATIPLHQLPDEAFKCVLQTMEVYDQLAYSLCSKNTKKAIKSLNLKAEQININVADSIEVEINVQNLTVFWSSMEHNNYFPNNQIMVHEGIRFRLIGSDETMTEWKLDFENLDFEEWVHHFCEVLHHPTVDHFHLYGENLDDDYIEPIQKVIKGLQIGCLGIWDELSKEFAKKVLESFPNYEKLFLDQISFDSQERNKLLIQNLQSLYFSRVDRLKIDQVLISNSEKILINSSTFNEKNFNRLLKLWIRGSNPRLKYFLTWGRPLLGNDSLDMNEILKRIKHNQIPVDSEEGYSIDDYDRYTKLAGGSRIWRFDGTTAVIVVTKRKFEFIVE